MKKFFRIALCYMMKYLMAFLFIFSTSVIIFKVSKDSIEEKVLERTQSQVAEGVQTIEDTIEKIELVSQAIYRSNGFSKLIYQEGDHTSEIILQLRDSKNEMTEISALTDYITCMFALFKKNNYFLSNGQIAIDMNKIYGESFSINPYERTIEDSFQFKDFIFEQYKSGEKFIRLESIKYRKDNGRVSEDVILYLTDGISEYQALFHIFGFVLNKDYLVESVLTEEIRDDGFMYIRDSSTGEVLLTYGDVLLEAIENTKAGTELVVTDKEYYIMQVTQRKLGWEIEVGIPRSIVSEQIKSAQSLLMTYLFVGLVAVIVLTLYFSLGRYYGFRKVLLAIPEEDISLESQKRLSDYDILTRNVTRLGENREAYRALADELRQKNRYILLENLMTRGEGTEQERQAFEEYFGKVPEFYCIAMVSFQQLNSIEKGNIAAVEIADFLIRKNISLMGNVHSGVSNELFLIELSGLQEGQNCGLQKVFTEIADEVSEKYGCIVHIGISAVVTGLSNISRCYSQAKRIVQSLYLRESENVVQVYNIDNNMLHDNPVNTEFLNRLYTMLICGRYADAEKELNQIEGYYKRNPYYYETHRERIFYSLENLFYTAMLQLNCKELEKHIPVYKNSMTCYELIQLFKENAAWICTFISQEKKSNNENLKDKIMDILNNKYHDPGLSAYSVSKEVGIAENYLYHFWKNQTGETFATYLLRIRINKAKEYLEQTDYNNKEIAALTGFSSQNTFYRNFQKLTGVSPKTYKENVDSYNK